MSDLDNNLKNAARESPDAPTFDSAEIDGASREQAASATEEFHGDQTSTQVTHDDVRQTYYKRERKKRDKPLKYFGILCIAASIAAGYFVSKEAPDTSSNAKAALVNKISTTIAVGALLSDKDENIGEQDYTLTHAPTDQDATKIWIWDYAAEDGDYVQVLVNGVPDGPPFMVKNKPVLLPISIKGLVGTVQVKGVRDGGGGITYAVHYELNNTTYFNSAPEGGFNTYTLENAIN